MVNGIILQTVGYSLPQSPVNSSKCLHLWRKCISLIYRGRRNADVVGLGNRRRSLRQTSLSAGNGSAERGRLRLSPTQWLEGCLLEIIWKSALPEKYSPHLKNKTKRFIPYPVHTIIVPFRHHHSSLLFSSWPFPLPCGFSEEQFGAISSYAFMPVTRSDSTPGRLWSAERSPRSKGGAACPTRLLGPARPVKVREVFHRAPGPRALGASARPALDGWSRWRAGTHILPEYEQQICQRVTGWQPRSQLLVHCCYISTLSKESAKRQSASSVHGRQVAS